MKKYLILFVLCLSFVQARANVIVGEAAIPTGYYNNVDGKKNADNILNTLNDIIDNHTVINYNALEEYYEQTDFYADSLWDMYSTCHFTMAHANIPQKEVCDGWNKEHLVCQSWLGSGPMVSDLFNVYPTDARINNLRSNYPYGVVSSFSGFSKDPDHHGLGKLGTSTTSGVGTVYEPDDNYKGDFARSFFYMVARYRSNTLNSGNGSKMFTSSPTNLTSYSLSFLLQWHRQDPVSQKEIDRNQAVYGIQHNRNPFIDYPELVEYIWGNKVGQQVDLSSMTPTCEGGGYDPTVTVKYGVLWSICGSVSRTDSVVAGRAITDLPETPESCSQESDQFMGWTDAPISGTTDEAPTLYKTVGEFPAVTEDVTYYAVFAKADQSEVIEPATYTFDDDHQDGWDNTAFNNGGNYWILREGQYIESPAINLSGLSSITINMRSYGGPSYTKITVSANSTTIATLTAASNSLADQTWTNPSSLSGTSSLRFVSQTATTQYGAAFKSITINATGSGVSYSRYITSCQSSTELVERVASPAEIRKILIGGQIYIVREGAVYTLTGTRVR